MPFKNIEDRRIWEKARDKKDPGRRKRNQLKFRLKRRAWWEDFKSTRFCVRCGEGHPACLEFHSPDGHKNGERISQMVCSHCSKERILEAIEKCVVLCANCHRKEHRKKGLVA